MMWEEILQFETMYVVPKFSGIARKSWNHKQKTVGISGNDVDKKYYININ